MKLYQIWFSILVEPAFTEEQARQYQALISNFFIVGNVVNGRELVRCLMTKDAIDAGQIWLESLGREPIICDVIDQAGIRYGYTIVEGVLTPIDELTPYPLREVEHDLYFDEFTSDNTSAGWANWYERVLN